MLKKLKMKVLNLRLKYHLFVEEYCFKNIDDSHPEHNEYWWNEMLKHVAKSNSILEEIMSMKSILD